MNFSGLLAGLATLMIIGLGFPIVIHGERLLGHLWWPYFILTGLLLVGGSLLIVSAWISVPVAVLGATLIWGSTELKEQAVRAELGWYPSHPEKPSPPLESIIARWKAPRL